MGSQIMSDRYQLKCRSLCLINICVLLIRFKIEHKTYKGFFKVFKILMKFCCTGQDSWEQIITNISIFQQKKLQVCKIAKSFKLHQEI